MAQPSARGRLATGPREGQKVFTLQTLPASPDRARVVPKARVAAANRANECGAAAAGDRQRCLTWAQRLKRVFAIDIEVCRRCGGQLRVIASIEEPAVIERILGHLGRAGESVDPAHPGRVSALLDRY